MVFGHLNKCRSIACIQCVSMPITIARLCNFDFLDVCEKQCKFNSRKYNNFCLQYIGGLTWGLEVCKTDKSLH